MPALPEGFGQWLRNRRKALDLTQEALGRLVSCSPHAIRKIEAGERRPSRHLTERLATHLGLGADELSLFLAQARRRPAAPPVAAGSDTWDAEAPDESTSSAAPLVGRTQELRRLRVALAGLSQTRGRAFLVEGEAGIGKTRLLRELCADAHRAGLPVVFCKCHDIERELTYHALADLLEQALSATALEASDRLDNVARAELALLLPSLAQRWSNLPQLSSELPQARQARLFASVLALLAALSERSGLLMVLDDLQWLDDASAQALTYLMARASRHRVLLVLACRSEDMRADGHLGAAIESLQRAGPIERIELGRLSREEVAMLARQTRDRAARDAPCTSRPSRQTRLEDLYDFSGGNPLFLLSALADEDLGESPNLRAHERQDGATPGLPAAVQALVRSRLKRLMPPARQLLCAMAVVGRGMDYQLVQALGAALGHLDVLGSPQPGSDAVVAAPSVPPSPATWAEALDELLLRRWIVDDTEKDEYTFDHDKHRDAVLAELGTVRRMRLHEVAAEALAMRAGTPHALIAEHLEQARQWQPAIQHRLLAGARAESLFAVREAIAHYNHGLAAAARGLQSVAVDEVSELLERRGLAHAWLSEVDLAADDLRPAANAALARGAATRAVELLTALGTSYQRADRYELGSQVLHQALALARELGDHKATAVVMFWLGDIEWSTDRNRASSMWFEQILALHGSAGLDDSVLVLTHHGLGEVALLDAKPIQALSHFAQSLALAQRLGQTRLVCENLILMAWAHQGASGTGHVESALAYCDQVSQLIAQADMPWYLSPMLVAKGIVMTGQGDFAAALQHFRQALDIARGIGMVRFETLTLVWLAECCLDAELPDKALAHIQTAKALMSARGVPFFSHQVCSIEAQALIRLQRLDEVPDLQLALARARDNWLGHSVLRTLESQTEWFFARGQLDDAERAALEFESEANARSVPDMLNRAKAWQARLLEARGHPDQALRCIERLMGQPTPPRSFGLRVDLQRLACQCAAQLRLPSASPQRQDLDAMLATLALAAILIAAFDI